MGAPKKPRHVAAMPGTSFAERLLVVENDKEAIMQELEKHAVEGRTWKAVYTIVERPGNDKKLWIRVGTAFVNRDLSLNVRLDASPTNGQLHIRDAEPQPPHGGGGNGSKRDVPFERAA